MADPDCPRCRGGGCEWCQNTGRNLALPPQREEYRDAAPLSNFAFAAYAAMIAHKSSAWAADTLQTIPEDVLDPIKPQTAVRYLTEIRRLLDHIEQQVQRR